MYDKFVLRRMYVIITVYVRVTVITVTYGKWVTIYIVEPFE